jgi:hypothetical protein
MPVIDKPLSRAEVADLLGVQRKTLSRWVRQRLFPKPTIRGYGRNGKMLWSAGVVARALEGRGVRKKT